MKTKGRILLFWVLTAFLFALAIFAVSHGQREPGWKGEPGLRLAP